MKNRCLSILVLVLALCVSSYASAASGLREIPLDEVWAACDRPAAPHPRLLITDKQLAQIQTRMESNKALQAFYQAMMDKADSIVPQATGKRIKTGKRMLGSSRLCLDRVMHLSAAYRFTRKPIYLQRAEQEMLAAAAFSDWNPSHFLDVAEMTAALAIGYDWLYHDLSQASRDTIRQAIVQKGIQPSLKDMYWMHSHSNWNQVCHGGITLGVLALLEEEPELARKLIHRAINGVQATMAQYEPDGAYPEGPGYWVYGTTYNVILLAALESALGTDFGLSQAPGFARSGAFYLHVTGPTGLYFNYPDSGSHGNFALAVYWFASKYDQPSLAWHQQQRWQDALADDPSVLVADRFAPLTLAWCRNEPVAPDALVWRGRGSNAVAMFRSSWTDPNATYLAIKGGSPGVSHGHMDVGSFIIDAAGLRWALDLGAESYHKIESRGMDLWDRSPGAERWTIFRYNNSSHNTLVVNGQPQDVLATAPIVRYSDRKTFPHVVFDMSAVYEGQLAQAWRGASLLPTGQILIQDEFQATDEPATVRWAMVTPAEVTIVNDKHARLVQQGKTMRLTVLAGAQTQLKLKTYSTEPKADYDAPNPNTRMIGFEVAVPAGQKLRTAVLLTPPGVRADEAIDLEPLAAWSEP
jgi:Heparinase II/III-like protein